MTLRVSDAEAGIVKPPCVSSHVEMFVCLSCLLQTNYNFGMGPRGPTLFQDPSSVTVKKHDIPVQYVTDCMKHDYLIPRCWDFSENFSDCQENF